MYSHNKYIFICIYIITLIYSKCRGAPQSNNPAEEELPTRDEEGRAINIKQTGELSNCACVAESQCKNIPIQTPSMQEKCLSTGGICCITGEIKSSALVNLLTDSTVDTKDQEEFDDCSCFTDVDCIALNGEISSFGPNSPKCPDPSFICCILNISDTDILTGIIETTDTPSEDFSICKCVPEQRCSQDLSFTVNVSALAAGNICESASHVCCEKEDVIEERIITPVLSSDCECVTSNRCAADLSLIFNVRGSTSNNICKSSGMVCCDKKDIINVKAIEPNVSAIRLIQPVETINGKRDCTCVPSDRCNLSSSNLAYLVDLRSKSCNDPSSVCCFPEDILKPTKKPVERSCRCVAKAFCGDDTFLPESVSLKARCIKTEVCCENPKQFEHSLSCGQSHETNARINVRVSLGFQAKFAEFPWMVAIFEVDANGNETYRCGGSLIHPSIVLTTAHCIDDDTGNVLKVRAGDWDLKSTAEKFPYEEKVVSVKVIHPSFSARNLDNNIGLLYLDSSIHLQYHINTICLPRSKDFKEYERACVATGWGKNEFGMFGRFQTTLKKLSLPIIDSDKCQESLRKSRLGSTFKLDKTAVCAGGSRTDACTGDGGSPLVCLMNDGSNRYMQVGVVSWGIECGKKDMPGVYASTFTAIDWVRKMVTKDFGEQAVKYFT